VVQFDGYGVKPRRSGICNGAGQASLGLLERDGLRRNRRKA